ncbi:MAG: phage tail protein [Actinomycetota bacterium]|nr:phage tail protein [Actinomycetota bacterium]
MAITPVTEVENPYLNYQFQVFFEGTTPVAAVTTVSGLTRRTQTVSFHAGGQPQSPLKIPGQSDYEPIRMERGITTDAAFEQWAELVWSYPNTKQLGNQIDLKNFRRNIQLVLYNQAGQAVIRYNIYNAWPSEYTALPELNSEANAVAIASLTIEHEGWDRDTTLTPPS